MRTNYSGFALAVSMGLIVVLIGFLALSAGGLVQLGPPQDMAAAAAEPADTVVATPQPQDTAALQPLAPAVMASLLWRTSTEGGDAVAIASGDALFKSNCTQCHAVNEKVVGPALGGIAKRRPIGWINRWVHNSAKVVASGDEYAVKLFDDNGKQQMPAFPSLSDKDIKDIVLWVSSQDGANVATDSPRVVYCR